MRTSNRRGFSLLEIMIVIAILAGILAAIYGTLSATVTMQATGSATSEIDTKSGQVLDSMVAEIRNSSAAGLSVTTVGGIQRINFLPVTGFDAPTQALITGPAAYYTCEYEDGDGAFPGDGVDNNQDGVVDEWRLVRVPALPAQAALTRNIAEDGFIVTPILSGPTTIGVTITLNLVTLNARRLPVTRRLTTSVTPKNK